MTVTKLHPSFTFTEDRVEALRAIAPEAFVDGRINWEVLHEALGDYLEDEGSEVEHFGLNWPGKREARRLAHLPGAGSLRPAQGEGLNESSARNFFIEGDNLEVLRLLQMSYKGRVGLAYIDPPYNTGEDFVYRDDYRQPLEEYLQATDQVDDTGRLLVTNTQSGGRFHSSWLSMMYPRLRLARTLLADDGVILVSIDDTECANLKLLMTEIFGEENFVANIVWQKRYVSNVTAQFLSDMHDHILVFAKKRECIKVRRLPRTDEQLSDYQNPDEDPRGPWRAQDLSASKPYSAGLFTIVTPAGISVTPPPGRYWRCNENQYMAWLADNRIWFGKSGQGRPMLKAFLAEATEGLTPNTWWSYDFAGHNKEATLEIKRLFDGAAPFDTPKPVRLIRRMLELFAPEDALVLDFFAGSCTTAHAVLEHNCDSGARQQFIVVQLPEPTPMGSVARAKGFQTIADIGKERIRRAIAVMEGESKLTDSDGERAARSFGVLKLSRSNFRAWQDYHGQDVDELQTMFDQVQSPLVEGWRAEAVLVEIQLMEGFPLDSRVTYLPEQSRNRVALVESDMVAHRLFVCLDAQVEDETIDSLAMGFEDVLVVLDSALSDTSKVRLEDGRRVKVI